MKRQVTLGLQGRNASYETGAIAPSAVARMNATRGVVERIVERNEVVYGITTGFGKLSDVAIPHDKLAALQRALEAQETSERDADALRRQLGEAQQAAARHEAEAETLRQMLERLTPPAPAREPPERNSRRKVAKA